MSPRSTLRRVLAAVAILALPAVAQAQTSRVEGMALPGDYIKDYTGIYTYTSGVTGVGNLIYGELGNFLTNSNSNNPITGDRSVGAVLQNVADGRWGTWGIHLREETPAMGQGDNFSQPNLGADGFDPNANHNESFDLMWGRKFGTTSLGLRLNRSFFAAKTEPLAPGVETNFEFDPVVAAVQGDENLARNVWGFGGGLGFEMNANSTAEVSLLYQSRTFENKDVNPAPPPTNTLREDDASTSYMVAARAMYQWAPNVMLVPVFKYYSFDLSTKSNVAGPGGTPATFDNSLTGWQVGAAGNWTVGNNDLFVLGVAFAQNHVEQQEAVFAAPVPVDGEATESIFPQVFAALETHVNNWLTLRFGASKGANNKVKIEPTAGGNAEITSSPFDMHIGAGVKLGTLQLDAILSDIFPQTLGWLGSGIPNVYFPKVTATYSF